MCRMGDDLEWRSEKLSEERVDSGRLLALVGGDWVRGWVVIGGERARVNVAVGGEWVRVLCNGWTRWYRSS